MADDTADSPAAAQQENAPRSTSIHNGANLLMELFSAELAGALSNVHLAYKRQIEAAKVSEDVRIAELEQALRARESVLAEAEARAQQVSEENVQLLHTHQQLVQEFSDFRCAADISRKTSNEVSEQQVASLIAERDDARSDATAMQVEVQQLRNEMAGQKLEREALNERIKKLEGEADSIRADYKKADAERKQARDDTAEARGALARLNSALGAIGLEYVQEDTKFYFSKEIIPRVADLFNEGQKAQAISLALASIQDKPDSTKKPLSPDALSPFNLATFITIMKDILSDVVVAGSGWEALCRSKEEGNALREQRDTLSTQSSRMKEAKDAAVKEWTEIKSTLAPVGLAYTDTNNIVFTKGLVSALKELTPMKEKLKQTADTLCSEDPNNDLQALLQAPEPKLSTPQNLIASMRKWFAVAQAIGDASLALCRSKEKELTELSVGRILQQDEIQLLNEKVKEAETQLKELDTQSQNEDSSSVSTSQSTRKRKKSSRASTSAALLPSQIASSSSQPFSSSTKTANRMKSDGRLSSPIVPTTDPTPSSRKRPRLTSSSISASTTSTTQRKRSPSVIIVGDSDDEISPKPPVSDKPSPKDQAGRPKKSRRSFVVDDDEPAPIKLRNQGVPSGKDKDKDKEDPFLKSKSSRSKPPSKSSQINKGSGKKA